MSGPSRAVEIEVTFDVAADTPLPDLTALPGIAEVRGPEVRSLDARYLDVPGYLLGRAGYAVRRRRGGPDEGWHIKGPKNAEGGRLETQWPLDRDAPESTGLTPTAVPTAVAAAVARIAPGELADIARIRNERHAYELADAAGGVVAEFVDDHVEALDHARGVTTTWREWEFELGAAAPASPDARAALFAAVAAAVARAGGRPAASDSKLARALGA